MMFSSIKFLTLSLVACVIASPVDLQKRGQNVIIGYRTAPPDQAARYNRAGTVTDDENKNGIQIGYGAYTSPVRGQWLGGNGYWFCVILADSKALDRVSKAWIPESYEGTRLWDKLDKIDEYIKTLEGSWNPAKTLRLSRIAGREDWLQMVIPPGLMNPNGGGMGISASCKENIDELPDTTVNYDDWKNNIKGDKDVKEDYDPLFVIPI